MSYKDKLLIGLAWLCPILMMAAGIKNAYHFWTTEPDPFKECRAYCASDGQGHVNMILDGMGGCMCDNQEGWRMRQGYTLYKNNECSLKSKDALILEEVIKSKEKK